MQNGDWIAVCVTFGLETLSTSAKCKEAVELRLIIHRPLALQNRTPA